MLFHDSGKETLRYLLDTGDGQSNREGSDKAAAQAYHGAGCRTGHQHIDTPEKAQTRKQGEDADGEENGPRTFTFDGQES